MDETCDWKEHDFDLDDDDILSCVTCGCPFDHLAVEHINKLEARIAELEQGWVPCSERLPDFDVPVLAIPKDFPDQITTAMRTDDGDGWLWAQLCNGYCARLNDPEDYEYDDDYQYSHWMPLPAPPEDTP